jgi:hypothetical protein
MGRRFAAVWSRVALLFLLGLMPVGRAQWTTQTIPLNPGWNAVALDVQPIPADCASVFAGLPIQGVWRWSKRAAALQFVTDPNQLLPRNPDWLFWVPPGHPQALLNTLFAVHAGDSLLIRLAADAAPVSWKLKGTPCLWRRQWLAGTLQLTGLPVPAQTTTFEDFFRPTSAVPITRTDGGEMYQLNSSGQGVRLWEPGRVRVQPGTAYWIRARSATDYIGPLRIELDSGDVLEFPAALWTRRINVRNESPTARTVTLRVLPSEAPPPGALAKVAGPVALDYCEKDWSQGLPRDVYRPLAPQLSRSVAPGATWSVELSPRRREMTGAPADALWQSLIEVTDGATVRQLVGVRAE